MTASSHSRHPHSLCLQLPRQLDQPHPSSPLRPGSRASRLSTSSQLWSFRHDSWPSAALAGAWQRQSRYLCPICSWRARNRSCRTPTTNGTTKGGLCGRRYSHRATFRSNRRGPVLDYLPCSAYMSVILLSAFSNLPCHSWRAAVTPVFSFSAASLNLRLVCLDEDSLASDLGHHVPEGI
jgi:hypothetical protein